jgi:hypothetical protein
MPIPSKASLELLERIRRAIDDFSNRHPFNPSHVIVGPRELDILREETGMLSLRFSGKNDTVFGLIIETGNEPGFEVIRKNGPETALQYHERMSATPEPVVSRFTGHVHTCPKCKRPYKFLIHETGFIEQVVRCTCGALMPQEFIK